MTLTGTFTALVTPFNTDGSVDFAAFKALVQRQIDLGIDGLVPIGTTGESPTLTDEEKDRLIAARLGLELAAQVPGAQLVWVPGAGHAVILEQPDLVNRAIIDLLARVAAGGLPRSA